MLLGSRLIRDAGCVPYSRTDLPAITRKRTPRSVSTGTVFAWARFVYIERAAVQIVTVERAHRSAGLRVVIHRDERKPARFAGHPIRHETDFADLAVLFEQILKIVLGGLESEITYVQFHCCFEIGKTTELQSRSRESGFKPPMSDAHLTIYRAVKLNESNPISAQPRTHSPKHK